jgi:hypothetical protein
MLRSKPTQVLSTANIQAEGKELIVESIENGRGRAVRCHEIIAPTASEPRGRRNTIIVPIEKAEAFAAAIHKAAQ